MASEIEKLLEANLFSCPYLHTCILPKHQFCIMPDCKICSEYISILKSERILLKAKLLIVDLS